MEAYKLRDKEMYRNEFPLKDINRANGYSDYNDRNKVPKIATALVLASLTVGLISYSANEKVPSAEDMNQPTIGDVLQESHLRLEDLTIRNGHSFGTRIKPDTLYLQGEDFILEGMINGHPERLVIDYTPIIW